MSIYNNAILAIQVGLEDYSDGGAGRPLSAVRNITAGILLLYKAKLYELGPEDNKELLIRTKISFEKDENDDIAITTAKGGTVNYEEIKKRFTSLGIKTEFKKFEEIQDLRNDVEHYFTKKTDGAMLDMIAKSLTIISNFLTEELGEEPAAALGPDHWDIMLRTVQVHEAEKERCRISFNAVDWWRDRSHQCGMEMKCPACTSSLCRAEEAGKFDEIYYVCTQCAERFPFADVAQQCVSDALAGEAYYSIKDGGESPYATCPECTADAYIIEDDVCFSCGHQRGEVRCVRCESAIGIDEDNGSAFCGYCNHQWDRISAE